MTLPARILGLILVALVCACVAALDLRLALAQARGLAPKVARDEDYNRLVRGFESGHLYTTAPIPAEMAGLPNPYDPEQNRIYRSLAPWALQDTSYFGGHAYLYFGVTPALIAFWPWHLLTGGFLSHKAAVAGFSIAGFLASAALLLSVRRRHFPDTPGVLAAGTVLVLGTATTVPMLAARSDLWEVPVSCGYSLSMLALGAAWLSWNRPGPRSRLAWLALAGLCAGLAVGARPTLVFGMVGLAATAAFLGPDSRGGGARGRFARLLAAALPLVLVGAGLALYNQARFGSPFEFGEHYQLTGDNVHGRTVLSPAFVPGNARLYLFSALDWSPSFPFAWAPCRRVFTGPRGDSEFVLGLVPSLPILLFAAAAPLAWTRRARAGRRELRALGMLLALMGACGFAVVLGFYGAANRYEVDYLPAVALLACLGLFACNTRLRADRPTAWGRIGRPLIGALLLYSCAAPTLAALSRGTYSREVEAGLVLSAQGRTDEGIEAFRSPVRAAHRQSGLPELAHGLLLAGNDSEALSILHEARRFAPDDPGLLYNLGRASFRAGNTREAARCLREVIRLRPTNEEAFEELGIELMDTGRGSEAIGPLKEALRLSPESPDSCYNLGLAYLTAGQPAQALPCLERAFQLEPELPGARQNLAYSLYKMNRVDEAMRVLGTPHAP